MSEPTELNDVPWVSIGIGEIVPEAVRAIIEQLPGHHVIDDQGRLQYSDDERPG